MKQSRHSHKRNPSNPVHSDIQRARGIKLKCSSILLRVIAIFLTLCISTRSWAEVSIKSGESIGFLGDSITYKGYITPIGYVWLVISGLEANGITVTPIPAGVSGNKSNQMLGRLQSWIIDKKPTWMTLSCGVNDVWHGPKGIPLDQYKINITAIVDRAQAAGIKVMIFTSTMIMEEPDNEFNQTLKSYNDFLRELAIAKKCPLADLSADMLAARKAATEAGKTGNVFTRDGVHMNPLGYRLMATGVLRAFGLDEAQIAKATKAWDATNPLAPAK